VDASIGAYSWYVDPNEPFFPGSNLRIKVVDSANSGTYGYSGYFDVGIVAIAPNISYISPIATGAGGQVTIYGSNLYGNILVIDGEVAPSWQYNSSTDPTGNTLVFNAPSNVGSHTIQVEQRIVGGRSNSVVLNVVAAVPTISYVQSPAGEKNILHPGERATIYGQNITSSYFVYFVQAGYSASLTRVGSAGQDADFYVPQIPNGNYALSLSPQGKGATSNEISVQVASPNIQPVISTANLKINGSDGPLSKTSGYATFSWTSTNADYCTAYGDTYWYGSKPTSGSETVWTGNEKTGITTYSISCAGGSGKVGPASDSVTVTFTGPATNVPTLSFEVSGWQGLEPSHITLTRGYYAFNWSSTNSDYCAASGDINWTGNKVVNGTETVWLGNEKTGMTTYYLTCGASSGKVPAVTRSVTVTFTGPATNVPTSVLPTNTAFNSNLWRGMQSDDVRRLQQMLAQDPSLYPQGIVSGYFGFLTEAAVQNFQCKYGIVCTGNSDSTGYGLVGPQTRMKLYEVFGSGTWTNSTQATTNTTSASNVTALQQQIQDILKQIQTLQSQLEAIQ
jgi:hypothetical protein